jgi:hypothetical protein
MRMNSRIQVVVIAVAMAASVQFVGAGAASADASGQASASGSRHRRSRLPGSSDEFPEGLPGVLLEVITAADTFGITRGAIFSSAARLHAGSHAECDKAG